MKETYPLLKECTDLNFTGSIEARDIPAGEADVIVCEAFVGNVILKLYEGLGATLISKIKEGMMTSVRSKMGALLVKPALKETLKAVSYTHLILRLPGRAEVLPEEVPRVPEKGRSPRLRFRKPDNLRPVR